METFVYLAGLRDRQVADVLRATGGGLRHLYERCLGSAVDIAETVDEDGALVVGRRPGAGPQVAVARSDAYVVVTYGRAGAGAGAIMAALSRRPLAAVVDDLVSREGCFGCLIHDRRAGSLQLFGDPVGQRTLRWVEVDGAFAVAPHDVALAATGLVATEADPVSLASVRRAGWSVGDVPLIAAVSACRAGDLVTLSPAGRGGRRRAGLMVTAAPRVPAHAAAPDAVALRYLQRRIGAAQEIEVEIDASLDARMALAAAVSLRGPRGIVGRAGAADADLARAICRRAGVGFVPYDAALPDRDALAAAWSRAAAACNGMIDARALLRPDADPDVATLCGDGGAAAPGRDRRREPALAERIATGPGLAEELREPLARRVRSVLRRLAAETGGADLATRFERAERWGVAAQAIARDPAFAQRVSPFQSRELLRALDALPEGGGFRRALIDKALPGLSDLPVWEAGPEPRFALHLRARAGAVVLERGADFLGEVTAPEVEAATWGDLGARRFLQICRDVSDAARLARVRAGAPELRVVRTGRA